MKQRIERLRALAHKLEPSGEERKVWTRQITAHAQEFIESLSDRPAFRGAGDEGKGILASAFSAEPQALSSLLEALAKHVEEPGMRLGSPGCMAFIPISSLYPAALGDYLAAVINPYAGNFFASPGAVRLEYSLLRWMAELVAYPPDSAGDLTSGGSLANLSALLAAREARELRAKAYDRAVAYLSAQTHHSIIKGLRIAGMSECVRREVQLDERHRIKPEVLEATIREDARRGLIPWLVVATAGTTDTGSVDPLEEIAAITRQHGLWLHVDGAYGAMFALCRMGKKVLSGVEQSDSLTLDPHKGLFMPCGSGAVLVRQGEALRKAYQYEAAYMQDRASLASLEEVSPSELSAELTRPFRGLRLWLSLKLLGVAPFRAALEEKLLLAQHFYRQVQKLPNCEVGPPPDLSVVVFRFVPSRGNSDEFNRQVLKALQQDGRIFLTSTRLGGQVWLRLAVLCAATHLEQVELALELLAVQARLDYCRTTK